jgi:hypothetical protein
MRSSPQTEEHVIDNLKSKKAAGHLMIAEVRDPRTIGGGRTELHWTGIISKGRPPTLGGR